MHEAQLPSSSAPIEELSLIPLTPDYVPERHGTYADRVEDAIRGGKVTNIALAGSYGSGKSSILRSVVDRFPRQVAEVALSPLRPDSSDSEPVEDYIQKEIVKQLLYVLDPARARASKFPRASKDRWLRSVGWSLGVGAIGVALQTIVAIGVVLLGGGELTLDLQMSASTFIAVTVLAFMFRRLSAGQWSIRDIKAGPTGLTVSKDEVTYFDKYLDEIVYFFQVSKIRVVVFEDMDRFGGTDIFASLRALNQLLNNAAQLKPSVVFSGIDRWQEARRARSGQPRAVADGPIVFVYAVRDSLIPVPANSAQGDAEADRFVRTKFFDLIIPVVPFVTPSNAREALTDEFLSLGDHGVSPELRQAVAQYFPDLRQLRNIRNEFQIYRERLLSPGKSLDQLDADRLFALVAYKNSDPADFEMIRLGSSKLDLARDFAAQLKTQHLAAVTSRLETSSTERLQEHASRFGRTLAARGEVLGVSFYNHTTGHYITPEQLGSLDVLREVANETLLLRSSGGGAALTIQDVEALADGSLGFARQSDSDISDVELKQLREDHVALDHATWRALYDMPQYAYAADREQEDRFAAFDGYNFAGYVRKRFGEGLVLALISRGKLTRDFALLITEYAGQHISVTARSFVNGVLESPVRTESVRVSGSDVEQILVEYSEDILSRAGMVNVDVLAHLLTHRLNLAERIVSQLAQMTDADERFLDEFLSSAEHGYDSVKISRELVLALARRSGVVLDYLARTESVDPLQRMELFGHALGVVRLSALAAPDWVAAQKYAAAQQDALVAMIPDGEEGANAVAALVRLGGPIGDLEPLTVDALDTVVQLNGFVFTPKNLSILNETTLLTTLALDQLLHGNPSLYVAVSKRLDEYLSLDQSLVDIVIRSGDGLLEVLNNLDQQMGDDPKALERLGAVAVLASVDVVVDDVRDASPRVIDALFRSFHAVPTVRNLTAAASSEALSASSAALLGHARQVVLHEETPKERRWLGNQIVRLAAQHPEELPPELAVKILDSLDLKDPLDIALLGEAPAPLAAALVRGMHVSANELLNFVKPSSPWALREAFLEQFPEDAWQLAVPLVTTSDVPAFLANRAIPNETKVEALRHASVLVDPRTGDAAAAADALVTFADRHGSRVVDADMMNLARYTTEPARIVRLMLLEVNQDSWELIHYITEELGEPYSAIFDPDLNSPKFPDDKTHRRFLARLADLGYLQLSPSRNGDNYLSIRRTN